MQCLKKVVKKRLKLFVVSVLVCMIFVLNFLNKNLLPGFAEYGKHQCTNIVRSVFNVVVMEQMEKVSASNIVEINKGDNIGLNFNIDAINSISCNVVNRTLQILYLLENGRLDKKTLEKINLEGVGILNDGMAFEMPISAVLGNSIISNIGIDIPVRYKFASSVNSEINSVVKEYGINNTLLEINLNIIAKSKMLIPMISETFDVFCKLPLVVRTIEGKIPDYYLGTHVIGEV